MSTRNDFIFKGRQIEMQTFHRLGILVLDGSGSMSGIVVGKITKAAAVNIAVRELLTLLISSKNKRNLSISVITFDDSVRIHTPVTRVIDDTGNTIDDNADYNPMIGLGGGADIARALEEARSSAEQFLKDATPNGIPHDVVIVVISDGMSSTDPIPVADRIKQHPNITICSTLFAQTGNVDSRSKQILIDIASTPQQYKTVYNSETFFEFIRRRLYL